MQSFYQIGARGRRHRRRPRRNRLQERLDRLETLEGIVRCISTLQRRRVGRSPPFLGRRRGKAEVAQLSVLCSRSTSTPRAALDPGLNTAPAGAAQQFLQIGFVATF